MKIRIVDIAKKAGVSPGTVDRIIHNRGKVSNKTRLLVKSVMEDLGYEPNMVARTLAMRKKISVGCILPNPEEVDYWHHPVEGILRAASEIKSFNISVELFYFSPQVDDYVRVCKEVSELNLDGIVYVPAYQNEAIEFSQLMCDMGISLVQLNKPMLGARHQCFVGANSYASGRVAASLMDMILSKDSSILIASVSKEREDYTGFSDRVTGFSEYFDEKYGCKDRLVALHIKVGSDVGQMERMFLDVLNSYPKVKGVFVPNSRVYRIAELINANQLNQLKVIGFDTLSQNVKFLKQGAVSFIISQQSKMQGYRSVMTMFDLLFKKIEVPKEINLPIDIFTKENIDFTS